MKTIRILIVALILSLTGCSSLIVGSGKYGEVLQSGSTRNEIRAEIGMPIQNGKNEVGTAYDWFVVHGRVAPNDMDMAGYTQGIALTLGIFDVVYLPMSLVMVPLDSNKDHNLWVYYNEMGEYLIHESDCWPFIAEPPNHSLDRTSQAQSGQE